MHRRLLVASLISAALGLTGCSSTATGSPSAAQPGSDAPSGDNTSSGATAGDMTSLKPCDLADPALISQLQLTRKGPGNDGGARVCAYSKLPDINGKNDYSITVGIRDQQGLKDTITAGYTAMPDNIGHHQGMQLKADSTCFAIIGVGPSTRVDVVVITTDADQACQVANQIAATVEPKLPAGGS